MSKEILPVSIQTFTKTGWLYFVRRGQALFLVAGLLMAGLAGNAQSCAANDIGFGGIATENTLTICKGDPNPVIDNVGAAAGAPTPATGLTTAYYWEVSTDGGVNYTTAPGNSRILTISNTIKNTAGVYMFKRFVSKSASCDGYSDVVILTVVSNKASAGLGLNRICMGSNTDFLGGSVSGSATEGVWSDNASPHGTFSPLATDLNAIWIPDPSYSGTATLKLKTTNGCAVADSSSKSVVVNNPTGKSLRFVSPIASPVLQDAAIPDIYIEVFDCNTNAISVGNEGNTISLSVNVGCGFVTQTATVSAGTAIFSSAMFTRSLQTNVQLKASLGAITELSNFFDVSAPGPVPVTETLWYQDYEGAGTWNDIVGAPVYSGSGTQGTDWTVVKYLHGNHTRAKSYTTENGVAQKLSTNTITFPVVTTNSAGTDLLTAYTGLQLRFKVGSLYDGVGTPRSPGSIGPPPPAIPNPPLTDPSGGQSGGSGVDEGEDMKMEIQIDGVWYNLFSYLIGVENYSFGFGGATKIITYNGDNVFTNPDDYSSFALAIPAGTSSISLKMTAANNRPSENWCIDDVYLTGKKSTLGAPKSLPVAASGNYITCPKSINVVTASITDAYPPLSYSWSPGTYITSGGTTASPTVVFPNNSPTVYSITATIRDVDNCWDTAKIDFRYPVGAAATWFGYRSRDWFNCENWGGGNVPTATQDVTIPTSGTNKFPEISLSSIHASEFANIAYANNISIGDSLWMYAGATLKVSGNLSLNYVNGSEFGSLDMTANNLNSSPNTLTVGGNWSNNTGTVTRRGFVPGRSKVVFDGAVSKTLTTKDTLATFYDLEIDKPGVVLTIRDSVLVTNSLTHTNGVINSVISSYTTHLPANTNGLLVMDTAAVLAGSPSASSYVNGKMAKRTNRNNASEFTFPIGKAGSSLPSVYQPAGILPVAHAAGTTVTSYTAEFYNRPPGNDINPDVVADPILTALLSNQYWIMTKTADAAKARVVMHYTSTPAYTDWRLVPGYGALTPPIPAGTNVAVAHHDGLKWAFTKDANNFNVSGPIYEAIYYTTTGKVYTDTMSSFSPFTIGFGDNTLLPVKLLSFEGRLLGADGSLSWRVADSKDLASFDLEYSTNGQQYKKLVNMPASASNAYGYLHRMLPPGTNYYRLLVKEKNGASYYSPIVILTVGKLRTQIVGLTNTLVKNKVGINILSASNQGVQARVTDVLGRQLTTQKGSLQAGINQWQLPTSLLAKGMYFVSIITDDGIKGTLQFVKE